MSELITNRLKNSIGKRVKIFLHNGFRYHGIITNCDDKYVEVLETDKYKLIPIKDINDLEVRE